MTRRFDPIGIAEQSFGPVVDQGLALRTPEDDVLDGRHVTLDGRQVLDFASCSYLGLERDPRLAEGVRDALERYGTQFSCSRSYLSAPLYRELEALLERIYGGPVLAMSNTTLGHLSTLPLVVDADDAVVLDHQVHESVQMAANLVKARGNRVELVRHSRLDRLEERIRKLAPQHPHVWYMCDGLFSMFGDPAPVKPLALLLARYPKLRLYIDDAHAMSWCGVHGRGSVLDALPSRERVVVTFSLNKAFAAAGGAIVFPNEALRDRVRLCGGPSRFSGPIQPPMLGAAIASARIHLSDELEAMQRELLERIRYFNRGALERELPLVNAHESPIRYFGTGAPEAAIELARRLLDEGVFASTAPYPVVPRKQSGVRLTLTRLHEHADLDRALDALARHVRPALASCGLDLGSVHRAFGMGAARAPKPPTDTAAGLRLECARSIDELDTGEWDAFMRDRGHFASDGLRLLESVFRDGDAPESRWGFHYYRVRDASGRLVAAAHFTDALWKDDMLASVEVSKLVERERAEDPYYLTTRVLSAGNLLSQGPHYFLDTERDWKGALSLILEAARADAEAVGAGLLAFRDVGRGEVVLREHMAGLGFTEIVAPAAMRLPVTWRTREEYLAGLSRRARRYLSESVLPFEDRYEVELLGCSGRHPTDDEVERMHASYEAVRARNLALNTFALPRKFFERVVLDPAWEIFALSCRDREHAGHEAFGLCHRNRESYVPLVLCISPCVAGDRVLYYRCLLEAVRRGVAANASTIEFGLGAETSKRRIGAVPVESSVYIQADDHFHSDVVEWISVGMKAPGRR